jgi:DcuC family C4-dicarboxylate transporter
MTLFADTAAWQQLLGLVIIALAVWAIVRELEVRLVLILTALTLGVLAANPEIIVRTFISTFVNEKFVIPLCFGMGFARVLTHTGCDQHLVHLLLHPLTYVRFLLVPGTVIVGFLVNMPIVSQTSTAVTIGSVAIPLLRAAGLSPVTIGAALLLGCSIGGELLNPGAPELLTTITESQKAAKNLPDLGYSASEFDSTRCVQRIMPLNFAGLAAATLVFWMLTHLRERRYPAAVQSPGTAVPGLSEHSFQVNYVKAAVPLVPLAFLYLSSYPFELITLDPRWLGVGRETEQFQTRLIGFAMLLGIVAAALTTPGKVKETASVFFEGAGYGLANIVSLIVAATCFGTAIKEIGIAATIGHAVQAWPDALIPAAGIISLGFAALCGSGMATAQSLFGFFAEPSLLLGIDPTHTGAVVSIAAAAGRTMSPVAAVCLMCARMTGTKPLELSRQVALPLLISVAFVIVIAMIIAPAP